MSFWFFAVYSFVLGAIVGSFLNVCIYRLPRRISLWRPRRSFCPICERSLEWTRMVPILSWLVLGGRCSKCCGSISFRIPVVEFLTGVLFLAAWIFWGYPQALGYWVLISFLVAAAFIDLEHLIIPDILTFGGMFTGFILSLLVPALLGAESADLGILRAVAGALVGYLFLWGVLEAGKWAFGKVHYRGDPPRRFQLRWEGRNATFKWGEEFWPWEEIFARRSDELVIEAEFWQTSAGTRGQGTLRFQHDRLVSLQGEIALNGVLEVSGIAGALVMPREAMGFGDVKFLAAIGAFLGWRGALFAVFFASFVGALVGAVSLFNRSKKGAQVPFGPFLATGALAWILGGEALWNVYFSRLGLRELLPKGLGFLSETNRLLTTCLLDVV